jgi:SAM-dependent methyltransferase
MSSAAAQLGPLTERRWPTLVGRDCAPIGAGIEPIAEQLVDSGSLRAGDRVLDVASGTGNAAIAAARRGCVVYAVDDLEALLEHGRERAAAAGLQVTFTQGHAMQLPYADASFDAVLSCMGVMFAPHHRRAAGELVRVCRPGGTIALANWTPAGFVGRVFQTVAAHAPSLSLMWPPGLWGTDQHLETLLGSAVDALTLTRRESVFRFRSPAEFVDGFRESCGPVRRAFDALDVLGRRRLHDDLATLAAEHDRETGPPLALPAEYLEAIATVRGRARLRPRAGRQRRDELVLNRRGHA